ncbi:MAG: SCO family protein [Devosia sp.]
MADSSALRRTRVIIWIAVVVVALAATAKFVLWPPPPAGTPAGLSYADASFTLTNAAGGSFTNADLKGKPSLMFFGYTFCPDVCPTTMSDILKWRDDTGIGYDGLRTIFVTIDPERDTPELLKAYLGAFDPNIIGLTGNQAETETVKTIFGVLGEKADDASSDTYLMNHTAGVFLIGADGSYQGTIAYGEASAAAEAKIKRLVNG